jgi:lipoprotein-anchoring transpeptidase ErfK/SrfK
VANPDAATVVTGQSVAVSPLANDTDPDNDQLTLTAATVTTPGAGTAAISGSEVVIAAAAGFLGTMVVDYAISDGTSLASSQITVTVTAPPNSPPVANPDSATMYAPGELRLDPLANDSDPDGDALSITAIAAQEPPQAGTATLEGPQIVVRTVAGYAGPFVIAYTLTDARGAQATGTVTITVLGPVPNRVPVAAADAVSVRVGSTVRIPVLANDSDPDGDLITLVKVGKASKGRATRVGSTIKFRAPRSAGTARVSYTIQDARGARAKGVLTVTVTKKPKPNPPSAGPESRVQVEQALARLGLPVGAANGRYDAATRRAVCTWRTIMGRKAHRGLPSGAEARAIVATSGLPAAGATMVTGVTVSVTCQAAFWVGADRNYRRVMAASTGKAGFRTRLGTFRVFRTYDVWRYSTVYPEARMYKPMQFSGGQALHGSATDRLVKTYPASHGCVRMLHRDIDEMQAGGVGNGTLVRVLGRW